MDIGVKPEAGVACKSRHDSYNKQYMPEAGVTCESCYGGYNKQK